MFKIILLTICIAVGILAIIVQAHDIETKGPNIHFHGDVALRPGDSVLYRSMNRPTSGFWIPQPNEGNRGIVLDIRGTNACCRLVQFPDSVRSIIDRKYLWLISDDVAIKNGSLNTGIYMQGGEPK